MVRETDQVKNSVNQGVWSISKFCDFSMIVLAKYGLNYSGYLYLA